MLHAINHYATLIVGLSEDYKGGEFILEVDGEEKSFHLRESSGIIFLTDMVHEIRPVTSGVRVVAQFDVYLEDADTDDLIKEISTKDDEENEADTNNFLKETSSENWDSSPFKTSKLLSMEKVDPCNL